MRNGVWILSQEVPAHESVAGEIPMRYSRYSPAVPVPSLPSIAAGVRRRVMGQRRRTVPVTAEGACFPSACTLLRAYDIHLIRWWRGEREHEGERERGFVWVSRRGLRCTALFLAGRRGEHQMRDQTRARLYPNFRRFLHPPAHLHGLHGSFGTGCIIQRFVIHLFSHKASSNDCKAHDSDESPL